MPERKASAETTVRLDFLATILNEMKADLKALPEKMASQYATKEELNQVKQEYQLVRNDIKELSNKMDVRDSQYHTKEDFNKWLLAHDKEFGELKKSVVTKDQFSPFKTGLIFLAAAVVSGIIKLLFDFFSNPH